MPKVSVLLPVYNGEKYLKEAIDSILKQTFQDFEFLIINDGSTDNSSEIISSYDDSRIKVINNESNLGLIASLNKGIDLSQGEYIARMDADDISHPNRLARQVEFMDKNQDIGICGSYVNTIGEGSSYTGIYLTEPEEIKANLLFSTSLAHPSVMIRKEMLLKNNLRFDEKFKHAEDYDLWERSVVYTKISNVPMALLSYRKHQESISKTNTETQTDNAKIVRKRQLERIGINPTSEELDIHSSLRPIEPGDQKEFINKLDSWLIKIKIANDGVGYYDNGALLNILQDRWLMACSANSDLGLWTYKKYKKTELYSSKYFKHSAKLLIRCLMASFSDYLVRPVK